MTAGLRVRTAPRWLPAVLVTPVLRWLAVRHAVPPGSPWRGACPSCGAVAGPAGPSGRCGGCGARLGPPAFTVEVLAVLALVVGLLVVPSAVLAAYLWWAALAVPLVLVDLAVHRLPDRLTLPAAGGVLLLLGVFGGGFFGGEFDRWWRAVLAGALVGLFFAATTLLLGRRGFGLGDAKLALSCAALLGWFGWGAVLLGLMAGLLASALVSIALLVAGRVRWSSHLPFGPFLVFGTLMGLILVGPGS
ncbi:A24 family peptidase [Asanoa sp. NPDC050611]|uniref:A24 family peptidase n=1 Tax=Asanoa sp. NPDC050611 TaxID=3157098 RepID=UPI0033FE589D